MLVYVLNKNGQPLMPTDRCGKVRRLLKLGKAKVIKRCPFTIQLLYSSTNYTKPITLGVDAGSKTIGMSAVTKNKVLYESEVMLRNDITDLLSVRRQNRRTRRNRKTRYRKARFNNRVSAKKTGWVAPSIRQKIESHLTVIRKVHQILPVMKIIVETASFDIQKIKNPDISGTDYQQGEQSGFWNVREFVLWRDGHKCQCCKGKSKDKILNVHHIESRKAGGNAPNNLVTLCETCHKGYHKGMIKLPKTIQRGMSFRDASFMGIMRWYLFNELKNLYPDVNNTYGYITKNTRIRNGLPKEHYIDARCISGNPLAEPLGYYYYQKKVRCHNRQIHKCTVNKGGARKLNQAPYEVQGFRLFDRVRIKYKDIEGFVFGRRRDGRLAVRYIDGTRINEQISYKKVIKLETAKHFLVERRSHSTAGQAHAVPVAN